MSVQTEINRLAGIKQDIRSAIVAKGQSISDTDSFSTYADKITAIETGSTGKQVAIGTITGDGDGSLTVSGLGFTPTDAVIFAASYYVEEHMNLWAAHLQTANIASFFGVETSEITDDINTSTSRSSVTFGADSVTFSGYYDYQNKYAYIIVGE